MVTKKKAGQQDTATAPGQPAQGKEWRNAGESEVWQPLKRGDKIMGVLKDSFRFMSKKYGNESHAYKILTVEGMKTVFGTGRLDRLMQDVAKEAEVLITYGGKVKDDKGQEVHEWAVQYR